MERLWQLEEGPSNGSWESEVVISLTDGSTRTGLHQASLASFSLAAESAPGCSWVLGAIPPLQSLMVLLIVPLVGPVSFLNVKAIPRHHLDPQTGWILFLLPALDMPEQ